MKKAILGAGILLACLAAVCSVRWGALHWGRKAAVSVSVIGGADGPTSIFLAGKVPSPGTLATVAVAVLLALLVLLGGLVIFLVRRHKRKGGRG